MRKIEGTIQPNANEPAEAAAGGGSFSEWMIRMVVNFPNYLRLYMLFLTDNRVDHKAKAGLITAIAVLGAHYGFGGLLFVLQSFLSGILGPLAFAPTVLIILLTLDVCYQFMDSTAIGQYEKQIFGAENSVQADIAQLRRYLGTLYHKVKNAWLQKTAVHRQKMETEGYIVDAALTDVIIQEAADMLMELETSDKLQKLMTREVKRLKRSDKEGQKALQEFTAKVIGE